MPPQGLDLFLLPVPVLFHPSPPCSVLPELPYQHGINRLFWPLDSARGATGQRLAGERQVATALGRWFSLCSCPLSILETTAPLVPADLAGVQPHHCGWSWGSALSLVGFPEPFLPIPSYVVPFLSSLQSPSLSGHLDAVRILNNTKIRVKRDTESILSLSHRWYSWPTEAF